MAEEVAAAHSSTQQPVSRQKADSDEKDERLILTQADYRKSLDMGK